MKYAAMKYQKMNYSLLPEYFGITESIKGFRINTKDLLIDLKCAIYNLGTQIARIEVEFDTLERISILIDSEDAFAIIQDSNHKYISSRSQAAKLNIPAVRIMPQLGLIRDEENKLANDTIEKGLGTRLSSRHFRNELLYFKKAYYESFKRLAESTWDGLRIQDLNFDFVANKITLLVYDGSFATEIGNMGSGLQMWVQIVWFISQCQPDDTIILDEPDVYMHPDMQKKIFNIVKNKFSQIIVATHSVEIISDVEPKNLVSINENTRSFQYANDLKGAQSIIDNIGGMQNLSLLRLSNSNKCIFVEGEDWSVITKILKRVFPDEENKFNKIPIVKLGGKSRYSETLGAANLFYNETGETIKTICLLDRDYSTNKEIEEYKNRAQENHLILHIWEKKEIENYICTPEIVFDTCGLSEDKRSSLYDLLEIDIESFRDDVFDGISSSILNHDKKLNIKTVHDEARKILNEKWIDLSSKMSMINGKNLIKAVCRFLDTEYSIKITKSDLINHISIDNIDPEMKNVLEMIIN